MDRYHSPLIITRRGYGEDRGHRRAPSAPDHYYRGEDHRRTYREQPSSSHASKIFYAAPHGIEASAYGTQRRHSSSVAYRHEAPQEKPHRVHWTPSVSKAPTYRPPEASYLHAYSPAPQAYRYPARHASYEPTRGPSYPGARLGESTQPVYRQDDRYKTSPPRYSRTSHRDRRHSPEDLESRDMRRKSRRVHEQSEADTYERVRRPERPERYSRGHTDYRSRRSDHPSGYSKYPPRRSEHETRKPESPYRAVDPFAISQPKRPSRSHTAEAYPIWNQLRQTVRHIGNKLFFPVHESHTLRGTSALKKGRKERRKD